MKNFNLRMTIAKSFLSNSRFVIGLALTLAGFQFALPASAANLLYSTGTIVIFDSSGVTSTISAGSVADNLSVTATSLIVTMSSSTGNSFVITSIARDLDVTTSSGGSLVAKTCSSGLARVVLDQASGSSTFTIVPASAQCTAAAIVAAAVVAVGGGGGGGGGYSPPPTPAAATSTTTSTVTSIATSTVSRGVSIASLQAQIAILQAQLTQLLALASSRGIQVSAIPTQGVFANNLSRGVSGDAVKALQSYLIAKNVGPGARALAGFGATGFFGPATVRALSEFQTSVGIKPAIGYFGSITRKYFNSHP